MTNSFEIAMQKSLVSSTLARSKKERWRNWHRKCDTIHGRDRKCNKMEKPRWIAIINSSYKARRNCSRNNWDWGRTSWQLSSGTNKKNKSKNKKNGIRTPCWSTGFRSRKRRKRRRSRLRKQCRCGITKRVFKNTNILRIWRKLTKLNPNKRKWSLSESKNQNNVSNNGWKRSGRKCGRRWTCEGVLTPTNFSIGQFAISKTYPLGSTRRSPMRLLVLCIRQLWRKDNRLSTCYQKAPCCYLLRPTTRQKRGLLTSTSWHHCLQTRNRWGRSRHLMFTAPTTFSHRTWRPRELTSAFTTTSTPSMIHKKIWPLTCHRVCTAHIKSLKKRPNLSFKQENSTCGRESV